MADKEDRLMQWLRDAHAMEKQAETMLKQQADRTENYPALKERIKSHIEETQQQANLVEGCIERRGGDTSALKDAAGQTTGMAQSLSGMFVNDEIVKGAMAAYTFENFEISSYQVLSAAAQEVGDNETKQVCEQILEQEERMADWLSHQIADITRAYLSQEATGAKPKD